MEEEHAKHQQLFIQQPSEWSQRVLLSSSISTFLGGFCLVLDSISANSPLGRVKYFIISKTHYETLANVHTLCCRFSPSNSLSTVSHFQWAPKNPARMPSPQPLMGSLPNIPTCFSLSLSAAVSCICLCSPIFYSCTDLILQHFVQHLESSMQDILLLTQASLLVTVNISLTQQYLSLEKLRT